MTTMKLRSFNTISAALTIFLIADVFGGTPDRPELVGLSGTMPDPVFHVSGDWRYSTLPGSGADRTSIFTTDPEAWAMWIPKFSSEQVVELSFYSIARPGTKQRGRFNLYIGGEVVEKVVQFPRDESGWVSLGRHTFDGSEGEGIVMLNDPGNGYLRASEMRFDVISEANGSVIQSFVLANLNSGSLLSVDRSGLAPPSIPGVSELDPLVFSKPGFVTWLHDEVLDAHEVEDAVQAELLEPIVQRYFNGENEPGEQDSGSAFDFELSADSGAMGSELTQYLLERAALTLAQRNGHPAVDPKIGDLEEKLEAILDNQTVFSLAQSLQMLAAYANLVDHSLPLPGRWETTLWDDFEDASVFDENWLVLEDQAGHILSSRWRENVELEDGKLNLLTKKEAKGGHEWTTGSLKTRSLVQEYGYFEASIKIAPATGLNNAFWLMNPLSGIPGEVLYELDVVEAHFPNRVSTTIHFYGPKKTASGSLTLAPIDLSASYNVYGMLWEKDRVVFYLNGQEIWELEASIPGAVPVRFSTAVSRFAGPITDALDGTKMSVDWVRAYRSVDEPSH
jgi:beta-glucanase (GH16 family)